MGTRRKSDWIQTYTGEAFDFDPIDPDIIIIEDIAHSLSLQCRYNGHCKRFYSVAEHSLLLVKTVPREFLMQALMHDAVEAYICDIPAPFKNVIPEIKKLEDKISEIIFTKFNINWPLDDIVSNNDIAIVQDERIQLMNNCERKWNLNKEALGVSLLFLQSKQAEIIFLNTFKIYNNG